MASKLAITCIILAIAAISVQCQKSVMHGFRRILQSRCFANNDCPATEQCIGHQCYPTYCYSDYDCPGTTEVCQNNICTIYTPPPRHRQCYSDSDCQRNQICQNYQCVV